MPKAKAKPAKPAFTFADAADELWRAEQLYLTTKRAMEAKLEPLKENRDRLEEALLAVMLEQKQESIGTKRTTVAVRRTTFAELYDDAQFFEYVRKENAFDLVRKQPVVSACRERWDDEVNIPGVRPGTKVELSITTRAKK